MHGSALSVAGFGPFTVVLVALAALVGALLIHAFSRRKGRQPIDDRVAHPATVAAADVNLPELRAAMLEAARRIDLPERLLPSIALPFGQEGDFIYGEGGKYVYCGLERGARSFEHRTSDLDDLLYRVFKDRAWTRSYIGLIGQELSHEDHSARLAEAQLALLEQADPRWSARLRAERD